jgi:UPF0716 protein FxsA
MPLLVLLLLPVVELYVFVQVAGALGFATALFWFVVATVVGVWLVKQQGLGVLRRANDKVAHGEPPTDELINGILLLLAGGLILTPGFVTDALGLLLLLPPTRALLRGSLRRRFEHGPIVIARSGFMGGTAAAGSGQGWSNVGRGDVWDADSWEDTSEGPDHPELR